MASFDVYKMSFQLFMISTVFGFTTIPGTTYGLHCYDYVGGDVTCSEMCCYNPEKGDKLECCDDTYDVRSKAAFGLTFVFIGVFIAMAIMAFCVLKTRKAANNVPVPAYNPMTVGYQNGAQQVQVGYPQTLQVNQPQPLHVNQPQPLQVNQLQPMYNPPAYPGHA